MELRKGELDWDRDEPAPGTAVTRRYEIKLWQGRWYVRDKMWGAYHGSYDSRREAQDALLAIGNILTNADLRVMRLVGEPVDTD